MSELEKSTIFIASGGTGGHIIPARCLAEALVEQQFRVFFLGDEKYKNYIKPEDKFFSKIIFSSKLVKSIKGLVVAALKIAVGILQSFYFFLRYRPKYVVAFGGYATFPVLISAIIFRTKIILHEQNAHFGKVNRIFAKYATKIMLSFSATSGIAKEFEHKTVFTGNPVRSEILALNKISYTLPDLEKKEIKPNEKKLGYDVLLASEFYEDGEIKKEEQFKILVIGGSGGAKIFSEILPKAFFNLSEIFKERITVIQQCRKELLQQTFDQYKKLNISVIVDIFFENMPELIKESHLVIARSGSSSIFEFCAAKRPMILVPFALAADNHQEKNARYLEKNGAAIVITEQEFTINKINSLLKNLISNPSELEKMSDMAAKLAVLDATENIIKLIKK